MSKIGTILREHGITAADAEEVVAAYAEPHRRWHAEKHVLMMLDCINRKLASDTTGKLPRPGSHDHRSLQLAACYHDVVHQPAAHDNEEQSAKVFVSHVDGFYDPRTIREIATLIIETAGNTKPTSQLSALLREADVDILLNGSLSEMLDYSRDIYHEYQQYEYAVFVNEHMRVLREILTQAGRTDSLPQLDVYESVIRNKKLRVGIYAGSFAPWHKGHADVLAQAMLVFDKVVIARGVNPAKSDLVASNLVLNPVKIDGAPSHLETKEFAGPLWKLYQHYAAQPNYDVAIVRGVRGPADIESEITQRSFVRDAAGTEVPYVFIAAKPELAHISSSAIKAMAALGADVSRYLL